MLMEVAVVVSDVGDVDVVVVEGSGNVVTRSMMGLTQAVEDSSCLIVSVNGGGCGTYVKECEEQENGREGGKYIVGLSVQRITKV